MRAGADEVGAADLRGGEGQIRGFGVGVWAHKLVWKTLSRIVGGGLFRRGGIPPMSCSSSFRCSAAMFENLRELQTGIGVGDSEEIKLFS